MHHLDPHTSTGRWPNEWGKVNMDLSTVRDAKAALEIFKERIKRVGIQDR